MQMHLALHILRRIASEMKAITQEAHNLPYMLTFASFISDIEAVIAEIERAGTPHHHITIDHRYPPITTTDVAAYVRTSQKMRGVDAPQEDADAQP